MADFEALKQKYPRAAHAPDPNCPRCGGTGQTPAKINQHLFPDGCKPCLCMYVNHEHVEFMVDVIKSVIKKDRGH